MSEVDGLKEALKCFHQETQIACERDLRLPPNLQPPCGYRGPLKSYEQNLTSVHNAIRCPMCGSTANVYNRIHSRLVSAQIKSRG